MRVMRRALRNFEDNSLAGLMQHEDYTTHEQLLMSWKYLQVLHVV